MSASTNDRLIAEIRRRANLPEDAPDRAFLIGIRHLLGQAADALEATEARYSETPDEIADRIAAQRSVGGYSGLSDNTRRIIRGAAFQAARAARGLAERKEYNAETGEFEYPEVSA